MRCRLPPTCSAPPIRSGRLNADGESVAGCRAGPRRLCARAFEEYTDVIVRVGKPPKPAIPFRTDRPFIRIAISLIAAKNRA
jgi:hypothetical protein